MADEIMENTRYKILLIEDDKADQMAFKRLVEDENLPYDCAIAGSISEAQSTLGSEPFDVIISDYELGDGTAFDIFDLMKDAPIILVTGAGNTAFDIFDLMKDAPIILVTGAGNEQLAVKAWRLGAYDYLVKDLERNYLKTVHITVENVIRRRQTEAKLQLLSGAIMSTDDTVYITDMQSKIIFVNKAFCETYGYNKKEVVGKDANILWMENSQSNGTRSVFQITRSPRQVGFYHKRKDGSVFPVSLSRSIIRDSNRNEIAVVGVARDISERILIEDELRTENLRLEEQNRLKSESAVAVSEQLTTSLIALKNTVSDAKVSAPDKISPKLKENLDSADESIDSLTGIINDFLQIAEQNYCLQDECGVDRA
jgi:PAS domain S-box-containing protein